MINSYFAAFRPFVPGFSIFITVLLLAHGVQAQRPSVAEMQAQIDALNFPYDEPAAQVRTTLDILPVFQDAVARTFLETGVAPSNRTEAGLSPNATDTQTSFISAVDIVDGTVVFTFGNDADAVLDGERLTFTPYATNDFTVIWRCGANPVVPGANLLVYGSYLPPTIPASAAPSPCILKSHAAGPDQTVKAQVRTVLDILPAFKDAIVKTYIDTGTAPVNRTEAGLSSDATDTQTSFISAVDVDSGNIVVTYGNYASALINGNTLAFTPYATADDTIVWRCGDEPIIPGVALLPGSSPAYSDIQPRYYPRPCIMKAYAAGVNETLSAQVLEPFGVVENFKAAIEAAGALLGTPSQPVPPANRAEAGLSPDASDTVGHYFSSVDIVDGVIVVEYDGDHVNAVLAGNQLAWTPYESADGTIVWICGYAYPVTGTQLMGTAAGSSTSPGSGITTFDARYLPPQCRP